MTVAGISGKDDDFALKENLTPTHYSGYPENILTSALHSREHT